MRRRCADGRTGLAWSMRSAKPMGWGQAIWDAENPAGNSPPVPDDQGRTDDYDPARTAFPLDSSLSNYCHELREGGLAGWRVPTRDELSALASSAPDTLSHFGFDPAVWVHSGQYPSAPCQLALGQCGTTAEGAYFAVCVRRAP